MAIPPIDTPRRDKLFAIATALPLVVAVAWLTTDAQHRLLTLAVTVAAAVVAAYLVLAKLGYGEDRDPFEIEP